MNEIKLLDQKRKINNSYETDPLSNSTSASSTEIFIKKASSSNLQKKNCIKNYEVCNSVKSEKGNSLKKTFKKIDVNSSQESDFNGFSTSQIIYVSDSDECYETDDDEEDDQSESDTEDEPETESEQDFETNQFRPFNREESNQSLKFKIRSKIVKGETIYEMFSVENSCNAVDMNLAENVQNSISNELSFDGKIKCLQEKNILNSNNQSNKKSIQNGIKNDTEFKTLDENKTQSAVSTVTSMNEFTKDELYIEINKTTSIVEINNTTSPIDEINKITSTDEISKITSTDEINKITSTDEINKSISIDEINKTNSNCNIDKTTEIFDNEKNKNDPNVVDNDTNKNEVAEKSEPTKFSKNILTDLKNLSAIQTSNELSPDLFDDEYFEYDKMVIQNQSNVSVTSLLKEQLNDSSEIIGAIEKRDRELLHRVQRCLTGIPPPPSKTIVELNLFEMISKNKNKILNFFENLETDNGNESYNSTLFKPNITYDKMLCTDWPDLLQIQYHGISYNVSKDSEKVEYLSTSVIDRYIGSETRSSYISSPSSPKKRNLRLKQLTQSPGSRLSHLAKRRAIFSSANLLSNNQKTSGISGNRQILLDNNNKGKNKRKILTPRRLITNQRRKMYSRNTPSSSAKKRLIFQTVANQKQGPSRESSKRALFQSPPHQKFFEAKTQNTKSQIKPEIANRVEKSKRCLFSPDGKFAITALSQPDLSQTNSSSQISIYGGSSFNNLINHSKRKRDNENFSPHDNQRKIFREDSCNSIADEKLTPKSLKIKSQSFCVGSNSNRENPHLNNSSFLPRARSDSTFSSHQLTESHTKKLLWAVSSALQKKQIGVTHPDFKRHASTLAKAIKRLFLEFYKKSPSTSETLSKLSKKYVYSVIQGKSVDYIYLSEKKHIENEKMFNSSKISGYIGADQYDNLKTKLSGLQKSTSSLFENSLDSSSWNSQMENSSFSQQLLSQEFSVSNGQIQQQYTAIKLPMPTNKSFQSSCTQNSLTDFALKENICDLRKSEQKIFSGKDQKNISPYKSPYQYSTEKFLTKTPLSGNVKRQISFDY